MRVGLLFLLEILHSSANSCVFTGRMEGMGNQVLMKHFVPDVPGPKLG